MFPFQAAINSTHSRSTTHLQNIFCFTSWPSVKTDVNTGAGAEVGGRVEHGFTDYKLQRVLPLLFSSARPLLLATERQVPESSNTTSLPVHTHTHISNIQLPNSSRHGAPIFHERFSVFGSSSNSFSVAVRRTRTSRFIP